MIPQYILDDSSHYPSPHRLGQPRLGQREYDWSGLEQILQEFRDRYRLIFELQVDYPTAPPRLRQATEEEIAAADRIREQK